MNPIINPFLSFPYQVYIILSLLFLATLIWLVIKIKKQGKSYLPNAIFCIIDLIVFVILIPVTKYDNDSYLGKVLVYIYFVFFWVSLIALPVLKYKSGNNTSKELKKMKLDIMLAIVAFAIFAVAVILNILAEKG